MVDPAITELIDLCLEQTEISPEPAVIVHSSLGTCYADERSDSNGDQ